MTTSITKNSLLEDLKDKETRDIYVEEHIVTGLPFQIHGLREKHGLTQSELAKRAGMAQERISKLEDPNYEFIPKIPTLLKLASVFDVPLIVKFGTWSEFFDRETRLSPELLAPKTFDEESAELERAASATASYTVPMRAYAAFPSTVFQRLQETPIRSVAIAATNVAFDVEELVAAAIGQGVWRALPDTVIEASEVTEVTEETETAMSIADLLKAVSSNTSIIDYSEQKVA